MKKVVFVAVCIIGLASFSSCRSTKNSCEYANKTETQYNQLEVVAENN